MRIIQPGEPNHPQDKAILVNLLPEDPSSKGCLARRSAHDTGQPHSNYISDTSTLPYDDKLAVMLVLPSRDNERKKRRLKRKTKVLPKYLSARQTASIMGLTPSTIYRHVNSGKIPFYRLPGCQLAFAQDEIAGLLGMNAEQKAYCATAPQRSCAYKPRRKPRTHNKEYLWIIPNYQKKA
jgi:excisionase family DNA binding protein